MWKSFLENIPPVEPPADPRGPASGHVVYAIRIHMINYIIIMRRDAGTSTAGENRARSRRTGQPSHSHGRDQALRGALLLGPDFFGLFNRFPSSIVSSYSSSQS